MRELIVSRLMFQRLIILLTIIASGFLSGCLADSRKVDDLETQLAETRLLALFGLNPADPYALTDNGDETVRANATGLTFRKCVLGISGQMCLTGTASNQSYCAAGDNSCNGGSDTGSLNGAGTSALYTACSTLSLAGRTGWRVPSRAESLVIQQLQINRPDILGTQQSFSTSESSTSTQHLLITSSGITLGSKTTAFAARCVL